MQFAIESGVPGVLIRVRGVLRRSRLSSIEFNDVNFRMIEQFKSWLWIIAGFYLLLSFFLMSVSLHCNFWSNQNRNGGYVFSKCG